MHMNYSKTFVCFHHPSLIANLKKFTCAEPISGVPQSSHFGPLLFHFFLYTILTLIFGTVNVPCI